MEQLVARQAHNLEVACSSPAPATTEMKSRLNQGDFFLFLVVSTCGIQCVFMKGHSQFMKPKATNSPINPKFYRTHRGIIGVAHPIKNVCNRLYIRLFLYI